MAPRRAHSSGSPSGCRQRVLFDRFLSLNARTNPTNSVRRRNRQRELPTSVLSADAGETKLVERALTENEGDMLSRHPPLSTKKILLRKISRNWQHNQISRSSGHCSTKSPRRQPGRRLIDASRARLKLARGQRHFACDQFDHADSVAQRIPRTRHIRREFSNEGTPLLTVA